MSLLLLNQEPLRGTFFLEMARQHQKAAAKATERNVQEMKIKEMIKEIEEAVDVMVESEDRGESFHNLKKSVVEKIHETEAAADAMLGNDKVDISDEIREKIREVGNASEGLLDLDNDEVSKEVGGKIKELAREIREASDVMLIDDRKK